jgi:hypothetical protein
MAVASHLASDPGGRVARFSTSTGMPPGHDDEASRNLRSLRMRRCVSSQPRVCTTHFMRARSLLSRLPVCVEDPDDRLDGGEQVLAGGELLERQRGVRVGAEAAGDEHPEAGLGGAVVERAGAGDHAHVVEHGLAAVGLAAGEVDLELAGQALGERVAQEVPVGGLGPGGDVEVLVGQAPARWQPITLRTVSPQASRVVRPTDRPARAWRRAPAPAARSGTGCSGGW